MQNMDAGCAGVIGGYEDKRMETEGAEERRVEANCRGS
jgi:hypothetical protein